MGQEQRRQRPRTASPGEAVYGLGLVGALAWYWQQAQSPGERAASVLRALVRPACSQGGSHSAKRQRRAPPGDAAPGDTPALAVRPGDEPPAPPRSLRRTRASTSARLA